MKTTLSVWCLLVLSAAMAGGAELRIHFPLSQRFAADRGQETTPAARVVYQTNERIDVAVVRSDRGDLASGVLRLALEGHDRSALTYEFPARAAAVQEGVARATEHIYLDARLLRPGRYRLRAEADGATAESPLEIYSHVRRSSFKTVNWGGRATGPELAREGEESLGYNVFLGQTRNDPTQLIRAGVDFMNCCTMSGGHQMDLRSECDWSDPYVTRGGAQRAVRQMFLDRVRGNTLGVHLYDEPGLTWGPDPATGKMTPHAVPAQHRAYASAFGHDALDYKRLDAQRAEDRARWDHWARFKLGFLDAAWKQAQFGVGLVRADYLSLNQSQYGWSAFGDGYYFNVQRSLPITLGHGGYDDYGPGYFNPSYFLEMSRARDLWKDCWYLPTWYRSTPGDTFRLEQYLSFQTGIEGLMTPPDLDPADPTQNAAAQAIVESNHLTRRLGTVLTTMPVTRPPVAMLYSLSQAIHTQAGNPEANYTHDMPQGRKLPFTFLAGKLVQQPFLPVLDEDVLDGTLAAEHKVVILTALDYLDPAVIAALEQFIAGGGRVLMTGDCRVTIRGAVRLPVVADFPDADRLKNVLAEQKTIQEEMIVPRTEFAKARAACHAAEADWKTAEAAVRKARATFEQAVHQAAAEKNPERATKRRADADARQAALRAAERQLPEKQQAVDAEKAALARQQAALGLVQDKLNATTREARRLQSVSAYCQGAAPLARAIKAELDKAGIKPIFACDVSTIIATRQAAGDIEYLFAVNATPDEAAAAPNRVKAVTANIALAADGRPVYDAVRGGRERGLVEKDGRWSGALRFGPGQMRVWARTTRPIGGVQVPAPSLARDFAGRETPLRLQIAATLVDDRGQVLSGSAPLEIRVIDPLGSARFALYRATQQGLYHETLPLAANDPPGKWMVMVRELLDNHEASATLTVAPLPRARALAGQPPRAVSFGNDREHAFRFGQTHHDVTVVCGANAFNAAAAARLRKSVLPWGIRCKTMELADAAKSRVMSAEEAPTWSGLVYTGRGQVKPGDENPPALAGFAVQGPVILLGNPEDHPIIKFLAEQSFLPYQPVKLDFPGRGRGMVAWQRDGVGRGQESITLLAYDEEGMNEAVGTLYEAMAGLEPLTPWLPPQADTLAPATRVLDRAPSLATRWTTLLPDRIEAITQLAEGQATVLSHDGTLTTLSHAGEPTKSEILLGANLERALNGIAPAPNPAAAKPYERPDRIVKFIVVDGARTAVAYWGGTVALFDEQGALKASRRFPQDITALVWRGGELLLGDADGRVMAVAVP